MLTGWNDTARKMPAATVPELFAAQAARRRRMRSRWSAASARLSYAELDVAGRAGWRGLLVCRGAGPETVVAVVMDRVAPGWWWRCWGC